MTNPSLSLSLRVAAALAICGSAWLAPNLSPSATFFNQALALAGWGGLLAIVAIYLVRVRLAWGADLPAVAAIGTIAFGVLLSWLLQQLPFPLVLSAIGLLGAVALALLTACVSARDVTGRQAFEAICLSLVAAGVVSALISMVQVFAPGWADGSWIARGAPGRASGNLRQPNHLSSLLLWSMVALLFLYEKRAAGWAGERANRWRALTALLLALLIFGDVLTVSRTGTVCLVMMALWGVVDRRLSRFGRVLLWLAPLFYILCWVGMAEWMKLGGSGFSGEAQLAKSDPSSSRFGIWSNTLELIRLHPWFGVGWGEFNFAWSLTPFPNRPVAFFDHTHNLTLNLLVEFGIPLGTLVLTLLAWSLWKAFLACRIAPDSHITMVRTAFMMVLMMVVHSMLEYPLWYAYFLLPTGFALGICLGHAGPHQGESEPAQVSPWPRRLLVGASFALIVGTVGAVFDYMRVTRIFSVDDDDSTPLSYRIAQGQKSLFFAHHADYAAATVATHPSEAWDAFTRAPHLLLDTRLMMAWAKGYAEKGDIERARYLADRLREFRNADSAEFFATCDDIRAGMPEPFQCKPATRQFTHEDFRLR